MKYLYSIILAHLISASSVFAAEVVPSEYSICTRDFNAWGLASHCSCPETATYDMRIGLCLGGALESVTVTGELNTDASAIGSETTGVVISNPEQGSYELVLSRLQKMQVAKLQTQGLLYQVSGDFLVVPGIEIQERPTIIVDSIVPLLQSTAPIAE